MTAPRKHAELIKAWADGATIQVHSDEGVELWLDTAWPLWSPNGNYRIKPAPALPDTVERVCPVLRMGGGGIVVGEAVADEAYVREGAQLFRRQMLLHDTLAAAIHITLDRSTLALLSVSVEKF